MEGQKGTTRSVPTQPPGPFPFDNKQDGRKRIRLKISIAKAQVPDSHTPVLLIPIEIDAQIKPVVSRKLVIVARTCVLAVSPPKLLPVATLRQFRQRAVLHVLNRQVITGLIHPGCRQFHLFRQFVGSNDIDLMPVVVFGGETMPLVDRSIRKPAVGPGECIPDPSVKPPGLFLYYQFQTVRTPFAHSNPVFPACKRGKTGPLSLYSTKLFIRL